MKTIELDGSSGEGGGQILRSALTLSMVTQTPFRITGIRAKRNKPGLLRQHLAAVLAAAQVSGAELLGAELGSGTLSFAPGPVRGGAYRFAVGSAGSATLVLQTIFPALALADEASTVEISGGTHNSSAPPADFLIRVWLPLMQRIGFDATIELLRHGFYPAGGGVIQARIKPVAGKLRAIELHEAGALEQRRAISVVAGLGQSIALRELARLTRHFDGLTTEIRTCPAGEGPGNVLMMELQYKFAIELMTCFGERGVSAETVADRLGTEVQRFQSSNAPVGEFLADQLVLPMALAGKGSFTASVCSPHLDSNLDVIQKFLPVAPRISHASGAVRVSLG